MTDFHTTQHHWSTDNSGSCVSGTQGSFLALIQWNEVVTRGSEEASLLYCDPKGTPGPAVPPLSATGWERCPQRKGHTQAGSWWVKTSYEGGEFPGGKALYQHTDVRAAVLVSGERERDAAQVVKRRWGELAQVRARGPSESIPPRWQDSQEADTPANMQVASNRQ